MYSIFVSCKSGGTLQLASEIASFFRNNNIPYCLFVPEESSNEFDSSLIYKCYKNDRKKYFEKEYISYLTSLIDNDYIVFVEDALLCLLLSNSKSLKGYSYLFIHDVISHETSFTFSKKLKELIRKHFLKKAIKKVNKIVLLSENSKKAFIKKYGFLINKISIVQLGSHLPNGDFKKPPEILGNKKYVLFIGRIDKYKNIPLLIKSYDIYKDSLDGKYDLIIAGKNVSSKKEYLVDHKYSYIVIDRFLDLEEFRWLVFNCSFIVLPYKSASQSGVLPISYLYGKPVVVNSTEGLIDLVVDGKTGYVCSSPTEFANCFKLLEDTNSLQNMSYYCKQYYEANFDFSINLKELFLLNV